MQRIKYYIHIQMCTVLSPITDSLFNKKKYPISHPNTSQNIAGKQFKTWPYLNQKSWIQVWVYHIQEPRTHLNIPYRPWISTVFLFCSLNIIAPTTKWLNHKTEILHMSKHFINHKALQKCYILLLSLLRDPHKWSPWSYWSLLRLFPYLG